MINNNISQPQLSNLHRLPTLVTPALAPLARSKSKGKGKKKRKKHTASSPAPSPELLSPPATPSEASGPNADSEDSKRDENSDGFYNFVHLRQLEKLSIKNWNFKLPYSGIPWATNFLQNLKKLKFCWTWVWLPWSEIRLIGMLPNLEILKLIEACGGREWEPCEGGFRQLKRLVIESNSLKDWNAVGDHFPVLEHLELSDCISLREIPIELADITTLALIQLTACFPSLLASAKRIQDEQQSYGNEALLVRSIAMYSGTKMAYAAVTSLMGTLHLQFLQSQPPFPLEHKQEIISLHENLGFLQEILEKSEIPNDNSAMKGLEAEIRDVLFKAEERIEMELTTIYLAKGWSKRLRIKASLLKLRGIFNQAVTQTDYLKKKLIKIQSEKQLAKGPSQDERMRRRGLLLALRYATDAFLGYFHLELFEHSNIQSFIVPGAHATLDSSEASGIWKMPLLRNFCIERIVSLGTLSVVHRNLESISWLDSKLCTKDLFTRIPNLKKLGIGYDENNLECFYNFVHLGQLEELSIRGNLDHIPCSGIPWATSFLPNLKKLKLFSTRLQWSDMRLIGMMPNLEVLKLRNAIDSTNRMWEPSVEGFRKLKRLVIGYTFLERWNAVGDHFPVLECLELHALDYLQEIPSGFADITTLALIQLNCCWDSVLASAKLIQEEQYSNYGNTLLVRSENIMTEGENNSEEEWDEEEESDEWMAA
nr:putative late blight resistance protein homolog R1B-17 isoform X4 [Ipomoea trifida]